MTKTTTAAPDAPPRPNYARAPLMVIGVAVIGLLTVLAWGATADLAVSTKFPYPPPPAPPLTVLILPIAVSTALAAIVIAAQAARYRRAREDHRVHAAVARAGQLSVSDSKMRVHARRGLTPVDVTVRADATLVARARNADGKIADAFARAAGVDEQAVAVAATKKGLRVHARSLRESAPVRGAPTAAEQARASEPDVAPAPAVRPVARIASRVEQALIGALDSDQIAVRVTDTTPEGVPIEVWVEYPAKLTSRIGERLAIVRDTLTRVAAPSNDEWAVRWSSHNDRIILRDTLDPLAKTVPLPHLEPDLDLHAGPVLGVTEGGDAFRLPLMGGVPTLIVGATGSGKGSVVWNIIRGVSPLMERGLVRMWLCDPKGGLELGEMETVVHRFAVKNKDCLDLLEEARDDMDAKSERMRAAGIGKKLVTVSREFPLDLVIIDELAYLIGSRAISKDVEEVTSDLAQVGRAPAYTLISATQNPRVKSVPNRSVYTRALAMRLNEASETNMSLGSGARQNGALADLIPMAHPGIGYMVHDGVALPVRFRTAFVSDETTAEVAARLARAMRTPPPIGAPITDADQPKLEEPDPAPVPAVRKPRMRPVKKKTPVPGFQRGHAVTVEVLARKVLDDPARVILDPGDPDPVTVTAVSDGEEDGRFVVTYRYDGETQERDTDMDGSETVTILE
ncbi:MAG: FtsK/SpoIIIE domain-containing protein [Phycicoccus sp.]